jgi:predicted enzyme related to lactoylglutathione lyase
MSAPDHGRFCWHDLMSTDPDGSLAFYGELLGWSMKPVDTAPEHTYNMLFAGEVPVGGIVPLDPDDGLPTHWMPYVAVDSMEDSCARAAELGGAVCVPPTDIGPGVFSVITDPQGGFFSLWKSKEPLQPEPGKPLHGTFCWHECMSTDAGGSADYYAGLFGWRVESLEMEVGGGEMTYRIFHHGDSHHGGAMDLPPPTIEQGARTHWLNYVTVDDVDASAEKAASLGAAVLCPCTDIPNTGRFCVIQDPQGGMLALFTHAEEKA